MQSFQFEESVRSYIGQQDLIRPGETVLAAVSGGADSVCLLLVLRALSEEVPFSLSVIHVEHGIRGKESTEDARFTEELCEKHGISCRIYTVNAPGYAAEHGLGPEEAARILRYEAFAKEAGRTGADRIALAHHRGDQAETVLFHLCRGSGLSGLAGIPASRGLDGSEARIIRPLLCTDREQIQRYLYEKGQVWREDLTNRDLRYARNRIRENILPELKSINTEAEAHIVQTADDLAQIADCLQTAAREAGAAGTVYGPDGICMDAACYQAMHPVLQRTCVKAVLEEAAGSSRDLTKEHVGAVCGLFAGQVGKRVSLPYGLTAAREYDCVRIGKAADRGRGKADDAVKEHFPVFDVPLLQTGDVRTIELPNGHRVRLELRSFDGNMEKIPKNKYTKWFDYDKIKFNLQVRTRRPGDFLQNCVQGGHRKLKDWMIDEKIPAKERDTMYLLAAGAHVLWVFEGRTSEAFRVEEQTGRILAVTYTYEGICSG